MLKNYKIKGISEPKPHCYAFCQKSILLGSFYNFLYYLLQFKRPMWDVLTGRRDGTVSLASDVTGNLPSPFSDFATLQQLFAKKRLNINDLVALSGGTVIST